MAEPTTTTTTELEIELNMQNSTDSNDWKTKTLTLANPITTAGGMSAIADFREFLLTAGTVTASPALVPSAFFQPTGGGVAGYYYVTKSTTARIVNTVKTVTPIE